ncbi:MAG: multidrug efflux SMR transporter [Propionibacteriaceae bacterium]|jgi:quaternary ammonium compound-resistance protein SugE|nr:multidrug efflux SMR transporter [Propionibacteriaceae bacterium]
MAWIVLLASGVCEAVWATALGLSHGLTRPLPTIIFFVFLAVSMIGLGWAVKRIPIGTAYAVWTGIGAALTVVVAAISGTEEITVGKALFLTGIIVAVVGLKFSSHKGRSPRDEAADLS